MADTIAGEALFQRPSSFTETYGSSASHDTGGAWSDILDSSNDDANALTAGQVMHDALMATSTEGSSSQVIDNTVTGANDAATIKGEGGGAMAECCHATYQNEPLTVTEPDSGEAQFAEVDAAAPSGARGTFIFNTAAGGSPSQPIVVTLARANDEPEAADDSGAAFITGNILAYDDEPDAFSLEYFL